MPDPTQDETRLRALLSEKVRDTLGVEGRQALFSAACLMAFADLDLAEGETACISALSAYLGAAPQGSRVTTRRQTRDQILANFRAANLTSEDIRGVLACLSYVALADGVVKSAEREFLAAVGAALGMSATAVAKILDQVTLSR